MKEDLRVKSKMSLEKTGKMETEANELLRGIRLVFRLEFMFKTMFENMFKIMFKTVLKSMFETMFEKNII